MTDRSEALVNELRTHDCDSDKGLPTCRVNWPDDPASWCVGCLMLEAADSLSALLADLRRTPQDEDQAARVDGDAHPEQPLTAADNEVPRCGECGCQTGGGLHCFAHAPYTVYPKADGTFLVDRNDRMRVSFEAPPSLLEPLKAACDRSWSDETPAQIVAIAANAIYWRDRTIASREPPPTPEAIRWQPIETAPKDGTRVIVFDEGALLISCWVDDDGDGRSGWWDNGIVEPEPTHWMPLPDPPRVEATRAEEKPR